MPGPTRPPPSASSSRLKEKVALDRQFSSFRKNLGDRHTGEPMEVLSEARPFTRSQSRNREKLTSFSLGEHKDVLRPFPQLDKSAAKAASHASISLLTPRLRTIQENETFKSLKRRSILMDQQRCPMEIDEKSSSMDIDDSSTVYAEKNLVTPQVTHVFSPQVLAAYNWVKERESVSQEQDVENIPYTSSKPPLTRSRVPYSGGMKSHAAPDPMSIPKYPGAACKFQKENNPGLRGGRQLNEEMEKLGAQEDVSGSRIMVYVRVRPMSKKEKEAGARSCVKIGNKRDVYLTEFALETDYLRLKRLRGRHFAFDAAFPDNTPQQEVYNTSTAELVEGVLQGRNGSVFCYGATGAGKTHTMLGTVQQPGVMVLALRDLFAKMNQRSLDGEHLVRLSYLEVYNESVRDLLSPGRHLVLREDTRQGIVAAGLTQYQAYSADEVMSLLQRGNMNRTTEPTRINETSSRSHAILQVVVEYKTQQQAGKVLRVGKLSLIDLAGSERALATDQRTVRSVEGANINRSLLALSSCINALVEGKKHIPFRNSKLTQLLKDSLGGECQTAMIANLCPSNTSFGETQNTLHWADRAKEIRTKACQANEELQVPESQDGKAKLLMQMQKENQQLKLQLSRLQQKFVVSQSTGMSDSPSTSPSPYTPASITPSTIPFTISRSPSHQSPVQDSVSIKSPTRPSPLQETVSMRVDSEGSLKSKKIWQLQRTVQLLEIEAEKTKRDTAVKEKKLNDSIQALKNEHTNQLKTRDEFIRNLCQRTLCETPTPIPSPSKCSEQTIQKNYSKATLASANMTADKTRRFVTPRTSTKSACPIPPSGARAAIPKTEQKATRASRTSETPQSHHPSANSRHTSTLANCCSPSKSRQQAPGGSGKKRTFWDITNSPLKPMHEKYNRRSSATTSMLLQPGFARRRMSTDG